MSKIGKGCVQPVTGSVIIENVAEFAQMFATGLEMGAVDVGCIPGATPEDPPAGRVALVINKQEDGTPLPPTLVAVEYATSSVIMDYSGPIADCGALGTEETAELLMPIALEELCCDVDGIAQPATPVVLFNAVTGVPNAPIYLDEMGNVITGTVTATDACDCGCVTCEEAEDIIACKLMNGFDHYPEDSFVAGDTQLFEVVVDGNTVFSQNIDFIANSDGINKSSWYTPVVDYINNNVTNWTMQVEQDQAVSASGRVQWRLTYTGPGASSLQFNSDNDTRTMSIDASGVVTTQTSSNGSVYSDFGSPAWSDC